MERFGIIDYNLQPDEKNIIYYKGAFSANVLSRISMNIRKNILCSKVVAKKMFSIFIELGQNVALYSAETNNYGDKEPDNGIGVILVDDCGDSFELTIGNKVKKEWANQLKERIEKINELNEEGLRKFKIMQREQPREEGQLGGNIGLIHVVIQAGNPFKFDFKKMDDAHDYLILNIQINKN